MWLEKVVAWEDRKVQAEVLEKSKSNWGSMRSATHITSIFAAVSQPSSLLLSSLELSDTQVYEPKTLNLEPQTRNPKASPLKPEAGSDAQVGAVYEPLNPKPETRWGQRRHSPPNGERNPPHRTINQPRRSRAAAAAAATTGSCVRVRVAGRALRGCLP